MDVSGNGLKIESAQALPTGCVLDLWVDDTAQPGKFFLSSEVRWSREGSGGFMTGLELLDGAATDINIWRERQA